MTIDPQIPSETPPGGPESAPDPGPIVPSSPGETSPTTIDPEPEADPNPAVDPNEHGLAGRDADQAYVDQEMADGKPPTE